MKTKLSESDQKRLDDKKFIDKFRDELRREGRTSYEVMVIVGKTEEKFILKNYLTDEERDEISRDEKRRFFC